VTTYYVSAVGVDTNAGTSTGAPWKTVSKVNAKTFVAGDVISFRGGDTFTGTMLYITATMVGTAANPVTYTSYGTGRATITMTTNSAIYAVAAGIAVNNLIFTSAFGYDPVTFYNSTAGLKDHVYIDNCDFSAGTNGLSIGGASGGGFTNVRVTNCAFHNNRDQGLFIYGPTFNSTTPTYAHTNVYVGSCTATNNLGNTANTTSNTGSGILLASVNGGTIEFCTATGNGANNRNVAGGPVGIWAYSSTSVVIQNCLSYSNHSGTAADGDGFDLDINTSNSTIQYCLAYNNDGAGILDYEAAGATRHTGNAIRYNLCWGNVKKNSGYGEITVSGAVNGTTVYNNTCVAVDTGTIHPSPAYVGGNGMTGVTWRNNALVANGTGAVVTAANSQVSTAALFQGNDYFQGSTGTLIAWGASTYATLALWRASVANQEVVSGSNTGYVTDPQLVSRTTSPTTTNPSAIGTTADSMKLIVGAAASTTGLSLNTTFGTVIGTRDYFGTTLTAPYSIGGMEQNPAAVPVGQFLPFF